MPLLPYTDQSLANLLQGLLLEPRNGGAVWPSGLWTSAEVFHYVQEEQIQLLRRTNLLVSIALVGGDESDPAVPLPVGTQVVSLPGDCLRVVRVGWLTSLAPDTESRPIPEIEQLQQDYGLYGRPADELDDLPEGYSTGERAAATNQAVDPNSLRLSAPTTTEGWLDVWYTATPALLLGDGEVVTVPDVAVPGLAWATIARMLRKVGHANDLPGAAYADEMSQIATEAIAILLRSFEP
jgi:hypothetical protein